MHVALQQMIDRCKTPFFVQVDEDMLLFPHAIEQLFQLLCDSTETTALICAGLWDGYLDAPIHGVKIYRLSIVQQFPYENTFSCEWTQVVQMRAVGYSVLTVQLGQRESCLGEHGMYETPETIFTRFQRLAQKDRRYKHMPWLQFWAPTLIQRLKCRMTLLDLYAFMGMVAGLTGELEEDRELDARKMSADLLRLERYFGMQDMKTTEIKALARRNNAKCSPGSLPGVMWWTSDSTGSPQGQTAFSAKLFSRLRELFL